MSQQFTDTLKENQKKIDDTRPVREKENLDQTLVVRRSDQEIELDTFMGRLRDLLAQETTSNTKTEILDTLRKMEVPEPNIIIFLLKQGNSRVTSIVLDYILELGDRGIGILRSMLQESDEIGNKAIYVLEQIGSHAAMMELIQSLSTADTSSVVAIVQALKNKGDYCVCLLLDVFKTADVQLKHHVVYALGEIGHKAAEAILIDALDDDDPDICGAAAIGLGNIGGPRVALALIDALVRNEHRIQDFKKQGNPHSFSFTGVQAHIAAALVKVGDIAVSLLWEHRDCFQNPELIKTIAPILGRIGNSQAVAILIALVNKYDKINQDVVLVAINAMESRPNVRYTSVLANILQAKGRRKDIYEVVVKALRLIETKEAEQSLIAALRHEEAAVRFFAVLALEQRKSTDAIPVVVSMLEESNPLVVARLSAFLENFPGKSTPYLLSLLSGNYSKPDIVGKIIRHIGENAIKELTQNGKSSKAEYTEVLRMIVDHASRIRGHR